MFNPAKASKNIKEEFVDYITTSFSFCDSALREQFINELNKIIDSGPWLEINDIFKAGTSINQLINEGVLSKLFRELESKKPDDKAHKKVLPLERKLFLHQEEAVRKIVDGHNVVVSTGTGSGKTNCFLIPVINELLKEKERGTLGPGVRALFIYPMNALANDQMKNLRHLLMYYPDITFGAYTGATEHREEDALAVYTAMFANEEAKELKDKLKNELLSREEMKGNPPNILFTNYAMLEHLLLRPEDDVLFANSDFKYIVLDEAHVYAGATGIETSILLRRLRARISSSRETQFILTSATLGDESSNKDVVSFTKNLCGVHFDSDDVIRGKRVKYTPIFNPKHYDKSIYNDLADESQFVADVLKKYGLTIDEKKSENELLYDFLIESDIYQLFRLGSGHITTLDAVERMLRFDEKTAISFVALCTKASKNGVSLLDARYHFFIRSLEGCFLSLSPKPTLFLTRQKTHKDNNNDYSVFEIAVCHDCGKFALVGKEDDNHLIQVAKLDENVDYYFFATDEHEDAEDDKKLEHLYLCPHCGFIANRIKYQKGTLCAHTKNDFIEIVKATKLDSGYSRCGSCNIGEYHRFYLGNDAATGVLATALYEELPEKAYEESKEDNTPNNGNSFLVFLSNSESKRTKKLTNKGKQFLSFSDSRQEAAKFACYMSKSYEEFLRRRGICRLIESNQKTLLKSVLTVSDFASMLTNLFCEKQTFRESNAEQHNNLTIVSRKNAWVAMLNELARFSSPTSLTSLGVLQFSYLGNTQEYIDWVSNTYKVDKEIAKNLLDLLAFEIVKMGAICPDNDTDINDDDREYIFYTPSQRFVKLETDDEKDSKTISRWMPKNKKTDPKKRYNNNRLTYVKTALSISEEEACLFLNDYFNYLISSSNDYPMVDKNHNGTYVMPAKYFAVKIAGRQDAKWYKCSRCGKVSQFNLNNKCVTTRCFSDVKEVNPTQLHKDNHFAKLYFNESLDPLFIKEHTAQLSKKESAFYQQQFIKKEINALSCSTTFEMGVDVGDLETVFLRDVPPLPSNYAQRAGRAGRSVDAAAYCLTFAKLSSHDLSFFKEPKKIISGTILPPLFKIDNEKIVRRHIYAVALSMFFANDPSQYNSNNADAFINLQGYKKFIAWIESKPKELKEMLVKSIPNDSNLHQRVGINDFSWIDSFSGKKGTFTSLINNYEKNVEEFIKAIAEHTQANDLIYAGVLQTRLSIYKNNKLIDFLARGNILPRYGFPVDTVELEQNFSAKTIDKLRLARDLSIAIAEYAPSSEIVADGRLYTSRYIKKPNLKLENKDYYVGYVGTCNNPNCQAVIYSDTPITIASGKICPSCGSVVSKDEFTESIEPRDGFVAEKESKEVPMSRQEKNYRSEDYYIGDKGSRTIEKFKLSFNGINVLLESTTNDSLLVKSTNNFYVCERCGYSLAEDENIPNDDVATKGMKAGYPSIKTQNKHLAWFDNAPCGCRSLRRYSLHHTFLTDVAKITFQCDTSDYKTMISVMYAMLYAMADSLTIERRDIKACLSLKIVKGVPSYSIIIYDSVPGGAGHSRRIVTEDGEMLARVIEAAYDRVNGCDCGSSCYQCLRSYENQKIHEDLDRTLAKDFLFKLLGTVKRVPLDKEELPNNDEYFDNEKDYIFVSYSHSNKDIVVPIINELRKTYNVWYDNDIEFGSQWRKELADRISCCSLFVFIVSKESLNSKSCKKEISFADTCGRKILLVYIENVKLDKSMELDYGNEQAIKYFNYSSLSLFANDIGQKSCDEIKAELDKTKKQ